MNEEQLAQLRKDLAEAEEVVRGSQGYISNETYDLYRDALTRRDRLREAVKLAERCLTTGQVYFVSIDATPAVVTTDHWRGCECGRCVTGRMLEETRRDPASRVVHAPEDEPGRIAPAEYARLQAEEWLTAEDRARLLFVRHLVATDRMSS